MQGSPQQGPAAPQCSPRATARLPPFQTVEGVAGPTLGSERVLLRTPDKHEAAKQMGGEKVVLSTGNFLDHSAASVVISLLMAYYPGYYMPWHLKQNTLNKTEPFSGCHRDDSV